MRVEEAKAIAQQWVLEIGSKYPGFVGAFYHGSINWLPAEAMLPSTSDLDLLVIVEPAAPAAKLGKFRYRKVMLEVSYLPQAQVQSPAQILGNYQLAGSFRQPGILVVPASGLAEITAAVAAAYAQRHWVYQRCNHARHNSLQHLQRLQQAELFHEQVLSWLFATGVTTHILLVAGLKNPTVRQRYGAARDLLIEYQHADFYSTLLDLLGCRQLTQAQVAAHLDALAVAFDAAAALIQTPFIFAADLRADARAVAIDGSRALIERGDYREAIFWMVATSARCQQVFYHDASPAVQAQFAPAHLHLLADLGIRSTVDLYARGQQIEESLAQVWSVAEAIMAANRAIEG